MVHSDEADEEQAADAGVLEQREVRAPRQRRWLGRSRLLDGQQDRCRDTQPERVRGRTLDARQQIDVALTSRHVQIGRFDTQ